MNGQHFNRKLLKSNLNVYFYTYFYYKLNTKLMFKYLSSQLLMSLKYQNIHMVG